MSWVEGNGLRMVCIRFRLVRNGQDKTLESYFKRDASGGLVTRGSDDVVHKSVRGTSSPWPGRDSTLEKRLAEEEPTMMTLDSWFERREGKVDDVTVPTNKVESRKKENRYMRREERSQGPVRQSADPELKEK